MGVRRTLADKVLWQKLKRWNRSNKDLHRIEFLKTVPFFANLTNWQLARVSDILFERRYETNELIFEQLQPGAALFLIVEGRVAIEVYNEKFTTGLAELESGAFFGEMALLDESPRSASARASEPTRTLALYRNDLTRLNHTDPETACHIYRVLAQIVGDRLRATNEMITNGEIHLEKLTG